ncbi:phosphoglycerate dehydrogenase [Piscirickettsia litoralis]|uniref:D-3-phosphoglycerate dehydrogenase n=1 Tax=Piscirickettsia litoralis TaxID=1891921 RepID=A0ABX3A0I0_9GAMM|nr:phosphoglycerate dehydrogenase [Piscirickettsia litoralis]ODN41970.1 D-3-phosphoglycerate dehydrogenase [Piscirickettsia litoralis]
MECKRPEDLNVLFLEGIHDSAHKTLHDFGFKNINCLPTALSEAELINTLKEKKIDLVGIRSRTQINETVLKNAPNLKGIGCFCIGTNQVNLPFATESGIPVFNAPHANTRSVAELVIGLSIMLLRQIFPKSHAAHQGEWLKAAAGCHEIRGKSLGIIGYGHIGSQVSVLAESLGMNVIYYDTLAKLPLGNAKQVPSLAALLQSADIVSLHVPESEATKYLIAEHELGQMKPDAILINASRGHVVDIDALAAALKAKELKGAALDVFPTEPKSNDQPFDSPLQRLNNVILTPHIGGSTEEAQLNIGTEVASKFIQFARYGHTQGSVNFPLLQLSPHPKAQRILHIHKNIPGMLGQINHVLAEHNINVAGQSLETFQAIGAVLLDIEPPATEKILKHLKAIEGTIKLRAILK